MEQHLAFTDSAEFCAFAAHFEAVKYLQMTDLFAQQPDRFARCSVEAAGLFLDYSKNRLTDDTLRLLIRLVCARCLEQQHDAMFDGVCPTCRRTSPS